jgi:two-component system, LytTR family, response regulator
MSKIRCIIIEDEPLAVKVLADYISQVPFLELGGSFKDAILATDYLRDHIHLPLSLQQPIINMLSKDLN